MADRNSPKRNPEKRDEDELRLESEVAQRRQKLAPHVSAGNIARKKPSPLQGATSDGRGRPSLQKQKGRPKAAPC